jgi:hypothetical protein
MMARFTDNPILIGVLALALILSNAVVYADMLSGTRLQ